MNHEHLDELLERHGEAPVPDPDPVWAARLESRLRARHESARQEGTRLRTPVLAWRPVLVGAAAAAAVVLALVLAGPFGDDSGRDDLADELPTPTELPGPEEWSTTTTVPGVGEPSQGGDDPTPTTTEPPASSPSPTSTAPTTSTTAPSSSSGEVQELDATVREGDDGRMVIEWSTYRGDDFAEWRVGRFQRSPDPEPTEVYRSADRDVRRAVDRPPPGERVFYVVVAVDARGEVVARSQPVSAPSHSQRDTTESTLVP